MNAADRKFLKHLETKVDETHKGVNYILNEIPVNGEVGLKNVLTQHHADIKNVKADVAELKDRGDTLWRYTEAIRARTDFWRAWKRLCEKSAILSFLMRLATHKVIGYVIIAFVLVSILVTLGYNVGDAIEKVYRFFVKAH